MRHDRPFTLKKLLVPVRNRAGLTLAEISAGALVAATVAWVASQMYLATNDTFEAVQGQGTLQMQLTQAADAFEEDVHHGYALPASWTKTASCLSGSGVINRDADSTGDGQAALLVKAGAILPGGGHVSNAIPDYFIYTFNATTGVLQREVCVTQAAQTTRTNQLTVLAQDISRVVWSWGNVNEDGTGRLEVTMFLEGTRPGQGRTMTLLSRGVLRNWAPWPWNGNP